MKWLLTAGSLLIVAALVVLLLLLRREGASQEHGTDNAANDPAPTRASRGTTASTTRVRPGLSRTERGNSSQATNDGRAPRVRVGEKSPRAGKIRSQVGEGTVQLPPDTLIAVRRAIRPAFYKCRTQFPPEKEDDLGNFRPRAVFKLALVASGGTINAEVAESEMLGATDSGFLRCVSEAMPELAATVPGQADVDRVEWVTHFDL